MDDDVVEDDDGEEGADAEPAVRGQVQEPGAGVVVLVAGEALRELALFAERSDRLEPPDRLRHVRVHGASG